MNTKVTKKEIEGVINNLAKSLDDELAQMVESDLEKYWHFKWEDDATNELNLYRFYDMLKLYGYFCEKWEQKHYGHYCIVERVRDKYLLPKIREFLEIFQQNDQALPQAGRK